MRHRYNPAQARDRLGKWTAGTKAAGSTTLGQAKASSSRAKKYRASNAQVAVVPYSRTSLRSQTVGINTGTNLSKHFRVSAGAYVRVERRSASKIEKAIVAKNDKLVAASVAKLSPHARLNPLVERGVRAAQQKAAKKVYGRQAKLSGNAIGRIATSRSGLPTVVVRKGRHTVPQGKSAAGITQYNARMRQISIGRKVSVPRPQRRKKAA